MSLESGSRVAVIGGGPAGSFLSYFLLIMAERVGLDISVDIYEPRDFGHLAPLGCNMCGGVISETLVQNLAAEGINLPADVVQRGIDSYVLHVDEGTVRIDTPLHEKRIASVTRGPGPRDAKQIKRGSFDGFLHSTAVRAGAESIRARVERITLDGGRYTIHSRKGGERSYDFVGVAVGLNGGGLKLIRDLGIEYRAPLATKTAIREYFVGADEIEKHLGSSMHVFLLDLPRVQFAAIIPKDDYVTVCLLGENIDKGLVTSFLEAPQVKRCMPPEWHSEEVSCFCSPQMYAGQASHPFADRMVFVGDCGVSRLYKDGIGAAYKAAKAAASTAIFEGISAADFERHYLPVCRRLSRDNAIGGLVFMVTKQIQRRGFARRAVLHMTEAEQARQGRERRLSTVLWDTFTGSASYREIFLRTLDPRFWVRFLFENARAVLVRSR